MKIDSNIELNKLPGPRNHDPLDKQPIKEHAMDVNLRMLTEKHNDEKLVITFLIVGTGLIAYHFW